MAGRRTTTHTDNGWGMVLLVGLGWVSIWTAPLWVHWLFPAFLVGSVEPWQLTDADLNTQRIISNLIVKPGLRVVAGLAYATMVIGLKWLIFDHFTVSQRDWRNKLTTFRNLGSTEFVVEGRRASLLVEFAREVGAVGERK